MTILVPPGRPDRAPRRYSATADAAGAATIDVTPSGSYTWVVRQVSIEMATAPAGAACTLRFNGTFVSALIATGDAAVEPPPIRVAVGDHLTVEWTGCTPGAVGSALVLYDEDAPMR